MRKNIDSDKNYKILIIVIILILLLNSITIIGSFISLNKRIDQLSVMVINGLKAQQPVIPGNKEIETIDVDVPDNSYQTAGNSNAAVKVMVVTDLECPFCRKLYESFFPVLEKDFVSRNLVQLSYMPLPIEEKHPKALPAAVSLYCANAQGLFWPVFHYLSDNIDELSNVKLKKVPDVEGIDAKEFEACIVTSKPEEEIHNVVKQLISVGINSTPTVIVDGKIVKGYSTLDRLFAYLDGELKLKSNSISTEDVKEAIQTGEYRILDVRTDKEFSDGHLPGAINIDYMVPDVFAKKIDELPKDSNWIVYCKSGKRSTRAYHQMKAAGFQNVFNMAAGFDGWIGN